MKTEKILECAKDYLIENIGNMVGPGEPYLDKKDDSWVVRLQLQI
ncbi:MAG: hypothetical protein ACE5KT_04450 [Methanosarcinales archaeon]